MHACFVVCFEPYQRFSSCAHMRSDCVVAVCGRRCGALEAAVAATATKEGSWLRYGACVLVVVGYKMSTKLKTRDRERGNRLA